jgi:hypothetical protein
LFANQDAVGDRKIGQQQHDDRPQRPVRQFPSRKNRRTNLNDKPCGNDVSGRDAMTFRRCNSAELRMVGVL